MRLFIKKLGIFVIIGLGIAAVLDAFISYNLKKSDSFALGDSYIWNEIYNGNVNDDLLIYGSSRAWVHFDPKIIEDSLNIRSYNLGIDGHGFWLQYLRHKLLIKHNKIPKVIVLSVGTFSLSMRPDLYNLDQFLPFIFDKDIYDYTSIYNGFSILDYTLPLYRYSGKQDVIKEVFSDLKKTKSSEVYRYKGFKGQERTWNKDLKNAKSKLFFFEAEIYKPYKDLMLQFLKECKQMEIKIVIVYSPEQVDGQSFVKNRNEIINTYKYISKASGFPLLDYSNDDISKDRDLFYNSMHLNAKGAEMFTLKFVSDLKKMKLIN